MTQPRALTRTEFEEGMAGTGQVALHFVSFNPVPFQFNPRSRLTPEQQLDRSVSEDDLQDAILGKAHFTGWLCYHVRQSKAGVVQGDTGFPDLVLARGGRVVYAELKDELGQLSPAQERWRDALLPTQEWYLWRPSSWRTGAVERILDA